MGTPIETNTDTLEDILTAVINLPSGGTSDYEALDNKPQIGGVELIGNRTAAQLGLATTSDVNAKYAKPIDGIPKSDLANAVQNSLNKADTALQSETYKGTVTKVNDISPDSSGNVSISIPAAVTESTVAGWGFTKNTGTYSKPSTGIPETDLASEVQTSLGKADTAMQPVSSTSDNAIARFDGTSGAIQNSNAYVLDDGDIGLVDSTLEAELTAILGDISV